MGKIDGWPVAGGGARTIAMNVFRAKEAANFFSFKVFVFMEWFL